MNTQHSKSHGDFPVFKPLPIATADEVRSLRQQMKMTQQQLGNEMGVTEFTVWRWENNKRPMTTGMTILLRKLARERGLAA